MHSPATELLAERDEARELVSQLEGQLLHLRLKLAAVQEMHTPLGITLPGGSEFQNVSPPAPNTPHQPLHYQQAEEPWTPHPLQPQNMHQTTTQANPMHKPVGAPRLDQAQHGQWQPAAHTHARSQHSLAADVMGQGGITNRVSPMISHAAGQQFVTPRIAVPPLGSTGFQGRMPHSAVSGLMVPQALLRPAVPTHQSAVMSHRIPAPPRRFLGGLFGCFGRSGAVVPV